MRNSILNSGLLLALTIVFAAGAQVSLADAPPQDSFREAGGAADLLGSTQAPPAATQERGAVQTVGFRCANRRPLPTRLGEPTRYECADDPVSARESALREGRVVVEPGRATVPVKAGSATINVNPVGSTGFGTGVSFPVR